MTKEQRDAFFAAPRVAILSVPRSQRGPLASPVWYGYDASLEGASIWFLTQRTAFKGKLLAEGVRVSMTVQTESRPYAYVSAEGPVTSIEPYDFELDLLPIAVRYLGADEGRAYVNQAKTAPRDLPARETCIKVWVRPEQWWSADYARAGSE